jgi:hypothetical protein
MYVAQTRAPRHLQSLRHRLFVHHKPHRLRVYLRRTISEIPKVFSHIYFKFLSIIFNRDMSVMTTLRVVGKRKSLIPVAAEDFCLQKHADRLWVSAGPLFNGYWGCSARVE